jgi:hypothetical protein
MHQASPLDSGLDVHQASSAVASVARDHHAEAVSLGTIGTRHGDSDPRIRTRPSQATLRGVVYEAGPCGSGR